MRKLIFGLFLGLLANVGYAASTPTTRVGLQKPAVGDTNWGVTTNSNWDIIDASAAMQAVTNTFTATNTFNNSLIVGNQNKLIFNDATTHKLSFQCPASVATTQWILPTGDGSANQVLQTNGAGQLSWSAPGNASALLSSTNTWTATQAFNSNTTLNNELDVSNGAGTSGYVLTSQGSGIAPTWAVSSGGGGSGTINVSDQDTLPFYSGAGFSNTLSGNTDITTDGFGQLNVSTITGVAGNFGSSSSVTGPSGSSAFHGAYTSIRSSGTTQALLIDARGEGPSPQSQEGIVTIRTDANNDNGLQPTPLVIVDSNTDVTAGNGLLEIWENNPNHNSYLLWIHGSSPRNSDEPIRFDGPTYGIDEVSTSTDGAHGLGKWKVISEGYQSSQLQLASSRAWDGTTFENLLYVQPFITPSVQPAGLYLQAQSLTDDSAILTSSDTSVVAFQSQNNHNVGLTGPLNPTASYSFALPSTFANQGQVLYQANNGRGNNNNSRDWAFTTGGSSQQVLTNGGTGAPYWSTVSGSAGNAIISTNTLQTGATFFVSSGTVQNNFFVNGQATLSNLVAQGATVGSGGLTILGGNLSGSGASFNGVVSASTVTVGQGTFVVNSDVNQAVSPFPSTGTITINTPSQTTNAGNITYATQAGSTILPNFSITVSSTNAQIPLTMTLKGSGSVGGCTSGLSWGGVCLSQNGGASTFNTNVSVALGNSLTISSETVHNGNLVISSTVIDGIGSAGTINQVYTSGGPGTSPAWKSVSVSTTLISSANLGQVAYYSVNSSTTLNGAPGAIVTASSWTYTSLVGLKDGAYYSNPNTQNVATYTAVSTDTVILASATISAGMIVNLPASSTSKGQVLTITKVDRSTQPITIQANGSDVISGTGTLKLNAFMQTDSIMADGNGNWIPWGKGTQITPNYIIGQGPMGSSFNPINTSSSPFCESFYTDIPITVSTLTVQVNVQSGNMDMGIYDTNGTLLGNAGKTLVPATGKASLPMTTPTYLPPGQYWMCMVVDNTTATFLSSTFGAVTPAGSAYCNQNVSAPPLASSLVVGSCSGTRPVFYNYWISVFGGTF